jgi:hypothetical protein
MSIEQRIATALSELAMTSAELAKLVAETEAAITEADATAEAERSKALDLLASPDAEQARSAMDEATFARDRLRTVLPRLQVRHRQTIAAENYARWLPTYEAAKAKQVALAQELERIYRPFQDRMVELLPQIEEADNEARQVNDLKPFDANGRGYGDRRYLCDTEQVGRPAGAMSIVKDLKLPAWDGGAAWPPFRSPCWGLQLVAAMAAIPAGPITPEQIAARNATRLEESERVIADYASRQREREEREAKEAREAWERQTAERNRRAGWG